MKRSLVVRSLPLPLPAALPCPERLQPLFPSSTAASSTAGSTAASAAAGPVTLQWSVWDKSPTLLAGHGRRLHGKPQDVTIEMDAGSSDYMTILATQLAGSADADVVTVKDIPSYANLIDLDYLKPLNEVLTRDTGDFNGTIERLTTDDGNYAVPFRSDFWVLCTTARMHSKSGRYRSPQQLA